MGRSAQEALVPISLFSVLELAYIAGLLIAATKICELLSFVLSGSTSGRLWHLVSISGSVLLLVDVERREWFVGERCRVTQSLVKPILQQKWFLGSKSVCRSVYFKHTGHLLGQSNKETIIRLPCVFWTDRKMFLWYLHRLKKIYKHSYQQVQEGISRYCSAWSET